LGLPETLPAARLPNGFAFSKGEALYDTTYMGGECRGKYLGLRGRISGVAVI